MESFTIFFALGWAISFLIINYKWVLNIFLPLIVLAVCYFLLFDNGEEKYSLYFQNNYYLFGAILGTIIGTFLGFKNKEKKAPN